MKQFEEYFGVPPENIPTFRDYFVVNKAAKKGKSSFQITKALLDNLREMQLKIGKQPKLIISINNYILTCDLTVKQEPK